MGQHDFYPGSMHPQSTIHMYGHDHDSHQAFSEDAQAAIEDLGWGGDVPIEENALDSVENSPSAHSIKALFDNYHLPVDQMSEADLISIVDAQLQSSDVTAEFIEDARQHGFTE